MLLRGRPGSFDPSHLLPAAPQLPPFTSFLSDITLPFFSPLSILRKVELRIPVLILYYPEGTHTSLALFSGKAARAARCPRLGANRPTRVEYTSRGRRHLASWKILWIGAFFPVRSRMKTFEPVVHVHWFQFEPSSPKIPPLFLCCEVVMTTQRHPVSALHLFSPLGQISSRLFWPAKPFNIHLESPSTGSECRSHFLGVEKRTAEGAWRFGQFSTLKTESRLHWVVSLAS